MENIIVRDPVQGLVDYVHDIKPYHTKVVELWVEYIHSDEASGNVSDTIKWVINMDIDTINDNDYTWGWDISPWDMFWNDSNLIFAPPEFPCTVGGRVCNEQERADKFRTTLQLYFQYINEKWKSSKGMTEDPGDIMNPTGTPTLNPRYNNLTDATIREFCIEYWNSKRTNDQYWLDPYTKRLFRRFKDAWVECVDFYYSEIEPPNPEENDYWYSILTGKLHMYSSVLNGWTEKPKLHQGYSAPPLNPMQPDDWISNWDYPGSYRPRGQGSVFGRVLDLLMFEHGTEIFFFDNIRTALVDPTGRDDTLSAQQPSTIRSEHPIKYQTTVVQTSRNRFKLERKEISIITDPTNPEIADATWTIDLKGWDFEGWDIERIRKDVKIGAQFKWVAGPAGESKQIVETPVDRTTFRFKQVGESIVAENLQGEEIACPWVHGATIYVRSTGDLPGYELLTQDAYRPYVDGGRNVLDPDDNNGHYGTPGKYQYLKLERYRPYKVVRIDGESKLFGIALADLQTLEYDFKTMGSADDKTAIKLSQSGTGRLYVGLGIPVPFMEVRADYAELTRTKVTEVLASPDEVFLGYRKVDVFGMSGSSLFFEGDVTAKFNQADIQLANTNHDGICQSTSIEVIDNRPQAFEADGTPVFANAPKWWTVAMGEWPKPVKKSETEILELIAHGAYTNIFDEYNYAQFTIVNVNIDLGHSTKCGHIVLEAIALAEPQLINNTVTTVTEQISFKIV